MGLMCTGIARGVGNTTEGERASTFGVVLEVALKLGAGPGEAVVDVVGEAVQGAHWRRLLRRIPCRPVVLRQVRDNHLHVRHTVGCERRWWPHCTNIESGCVQARIAPGNRRRQVCRMVLQLGVLGERST